MVRELPSQGHPVWVELISGKRSVEFSHLAVRMLLKKVQQDYRNGSDVERCVSEIRNVFIQNGNAPKIRQDMELLG